MLNKSSHILKGKGRDSKYGAARHPKLFVFYGAKELNGGTLSSVICVLMVFPPWKKTENHFE
jgi:hypothetical protein